MVVNSGNANTCTGQKGLKNAKQMCAETAYSLNAIRNTRRGGARRSPTQYAARDILVASTGIIGKQLPIKKITGGISKAAAKLSASASAGLDFARAIMTTDTKPKQAVRRLEISGAAITIAGAVKGAGMIAPNMATTLLFITTDVAISKYLLGRALKRAVGNSLNKLTVDGHQSTNDTAIILASGLADNRTIVSQCPRYKRFAKALGQLCDDLAKQMALDAEGATRMFKSCQRCGYKGRCSKSEQGNSRLSAGKMCGERRRPQLGQNYLCRRFGRCKVESKYTILQAWRYNCFYQWCPEKIRCEKGK